MSSIKKLAGQTALYGLSSILARAINFLLVPFYLDERFGNLSPTVFGVLTEYMIYVSFLLVILSFGMETTYFRYSQNKVEEPKVFSQLLTYVFSWTSIICIGMYFGSGQLENLISKTGDASYIQLIAIILFLDIISALPFARLRNNNNAVKFVIVKMSSIFVNVGLNMLFIWYLPVVAKLEVLQVSGVSLDLSDQVYCILIANVIANSLFLFFFLKDFKLLFRHWDKAYVAPVFKYAYPIMILGLAGIINEMIDRLMLKNILSDRFYSDLGLDSVGATGVYAANYKFAVFITLAIQAYRYAAEPFFFKAEKEKDSKETFAKLMNIFTVFLLGMAVVISIFRQEIGMLILRQDIFKEGLVVVPWLLMANVCVGIYYNLSAWYKLTDKTIYGTLIGITGAVLTVVLNFILIPYIGYLGSAITTFVCYAFMMVTSYLLGQKYYPVPYQVSRILLYFSVASLLILCSTFVLEQLPLSFIYKGLACIVFGVFVYLMEFKKRLKS